MGQFNPFVGNMSGSTSTNNKSIDKVVFLTSTKGTKPGLPGATDTYVIIFTDKTRTSYKVYNGENGKSAYDIAVEQGFQGSQKDWIESLQGNGNKDKPITDEEIDKLF